jgi:pilus assembly protein CpaF
MTLMAAIELPLRAVRDQIAAALDLVVHISRLRDGSRRVTQITEITGTDGDNVSTSTLFTYDSTAGALVSTGTTPTFSERRGDDEVAR